MGHNRQWLERNRAGLKPRWERDQNDLPLPVEPEKPYDRYSEV